MKRTPPRVAISPAARTVVFVFFCALCFSANAEKIIIKPFTSDGCSAWPEGTLSEKNLWRRCCVIHDLAYWKGGTRAARINADRALEQCVADVGEPAIAAVMLAGVRVGGSPYWPTRFRWGYGWEWLRGYKAVTTEEQAVIDDMLNANGGLDALLTQ